jgi:hypothetical protein
LTTEPSIPTISAENLDKLLSAADGETLPDINKADYVGQEISLRTLQKWLQDRSYYWSGETPWITSRHAGGPDGIMFVCNLKKGDFILLLRGSHDPFKLTDWTWVKKSDARISMTNITVVHGSDPNNYDVLRLSFGFVNWNESNGRFQIERYLVPDSVVEISEDGNSIRLLPKVPDNYRVFFSGN